MVERKPLFWIWNLLACSLIVGGGASADLPKALQQDLDELNVKLDRIEKQIGGFSPKEVEQSLGEAKQWIDEFAVDAELLDDDPILVGLRKRLGGLSQRAATAAKEAMRAEEKKKAEPAKSASQKLEELLKIDVDLKNVSFKRDVAPLIAESCLGCHNANRASGDFDASKFETFVEQIEPGKPEESHILKLVTGRAQPRMPRGGGGFSREAVDIWTAWVKAGAKFDGPAEDAAITTYLVDSDAKRREKIGALSVKELEGLHLLALEKQLDLVRPQRPLHAFETPNFLVRTTMEEPDAEYIAVLAEVVLEELGPRYKRSPSEPLWPGRMGITVFRDRYDYVAFAKQVDSYSPEDYEFGHVRLRPEHQYIAMTSQVAGASLDQLVAEQVAAAFFRTLGKGKMPEWAVYGNARVESVAWDPTGSANVKEELRTAGDLAAQGRTLGGMMDGKLPWVEAAPIATSFLSFASSTDRPKTAAFNLLLADGKAAGGAASEALRSSVEQLNSTWAAWAVKRQGKKR